ncbi:MULTISPECIES: hypothetical protein [Streptomyces]|uniref:Uncharacterized protein n=1 Tax=Streptomyces sp. 900129855 TaxID=3155129 RepID=A0ABV2ZJ24_9ACTN
MPSRKPTTNSPMPRKDNVAWCAWHGAYSNTARPVRDTSGARLFACQSCRDIYDLAPIADQP